MVLYIAFKKMENDLPELELDDDVGGSVSGDDAVNVESFDELLETLPELNLDSRSYATKIERYLMYSLFSRDALNELVAIILSNNKDTERFFSTELTSRDQFLSHLELDNPLMRGYYDEVKNKRDLVKFPYDESVGVYKCRDPKCGSMNTGTIHKQMNSGDEGMIALLVCFVCLRHFKL